MCDSEIWTKIACSWKQRKIWVSRLILHFVSIMHMMQVSASTCTWLMFWIQWDCPHLKACNWKINQAYSNLHKAKSGTVRNTECLAAVLKFIFTQRKPKHKQKPPKKKQCSKICHFHKPDIFTQLHQFTVLVYASPPIVLPLLSPTFPADWESASL